MGTKIGNPGKSVDEYIDTVTLTHDFIKSVTHVTEARFEALSSTFYAPTVPNRPSET